LTAGLPENPFVGLRPFRSEEALLFFGRRQQTAELMDRLHRTRFLAVVGSSGCGKSSLIRAGLIPRLKAGFLVENRDRWVDITMTPGETPLARLAGELRITEVELQEGGAPALIEQLERQPGAAENNCLLLIDQFEEVFRFAVSGGNREDAADFVALLLAVAAQRDFPVFVVLTMRSDFLGDCDAFYGLPEALNRGQYLVPRLTRQQRRESVESPIRLFGGAVTAQFVDRVLNDVGDEPDQLPVMEHALMRTWEAWQKAGSAGPVDLPNYLAIGGAKDALSKDAQCALEAMTSQQRGLTAPIFKALTDTDANNRRIRRPVRLSQLTLITGRSSAEIERVINHFREGGRSFLIVQPDPASGDALIDISHESLIRQWGDLRLWVDEEAESKRIYLDLVNAVERKKALLHDSDLQIALDWRERTKPTEAWARRYHPRFADAMAFLDASQEEARREAEEKERHRRQELGRARRAAVMFLILALVAAGTALWALNAQAKAKAAARNAEISAKAEAKAALEAKEATASAVVAQQMAEDQKQKATQSAQEAIKLGTIAQAEREKAIAGELDAARAAQMEKLARQEAQDNAKLAADQADAAKKERDKADAERKIADDQRKIAEAQRQEAEAQRKNVAKSLALSIVQDAVRLVDLGKKEPALAYLAKALTLDPESLGARSWIFDLLVRGGFHPERAPYIHKPWQHTARVLCATFNPDGKRVVTASFDKTARIWDAEGKASVTLPHRDLVNSAAFSADGKRVVTACWDGTAQVWNAETGQPDGPPLRHKGPVTSAAFSADGRVVTASYDKTAQVWDAAGRPLMTLPHKSPVNSAAFSLDGHRLVTASWDNTAQVWDGEGKPSGATLHHQGQVRGAAFSPDGRLVVTASADQTARVWEAETGRPVGDSLRHPAAVNWAAFSPDSRRVVTASDDNTARVWEAATGTPVGAPLRRENRVSSAAFSPDGKRVVTASYDNTAQLWDVWLDFDNPGLLAKLAEAVSGYQAEKVPDLVPLANRQKQLEEVRGLVQQTAQGAATTASFIRWYLSGPN
jgi:hypothetical protein